MNQNIQSIQDAFQFMKRDINAMPDVSMLPEDQQKAAIAFCKLMTGVEAVNTDPETGKQWKPNWYDSNETKYWPWFDMRSGSGRSYCDYDDVWTRSTVGSRLCYQSSEAAEHGVKVFKELYQDIFLIS